MLCDNSNYMCVLDDSITCYIVSHMTLSVWTSISSMVNIMHECELYSCICCRIMYRLDSMKCTCVSWLLYGCINLFMICKMYTYTSDNHI